ncbi:hypothetical protein Anapl_08842 [Anas platyrhynchos]|uniref:Uncharacterized protein n=1 Tax=Anas platyrhynchos TaxID=8839 RepID=R0LFN6_ANAPL|nr:hypothetical protein Anapl_08842 [Anas platyrhynchos]
MSSPGIHVSVLKDTRREMTPALPPGPSPLPKVRDCLHRLFLQSLRSVHLPGKANIMLKSTGCKCSQSSHTADSLPPEEDQNYRHKQQLLTVKHSLNKSVFSLRSIILLARTPDMLLELLAVGSTDGCTVQALLCGDNAKCSLQLAGFFPPPTPGAGTRQKLGARCPSEEHAFSFSSAEPSPNNNHLQRDAFCVLACWMQTRDISLDPTPTGAQTDAALQTLQTSTRAQLTQFPHTITEKSVLFFLCFSCSSKASPQGWNQSHVSRNIIRGKEVKAVYGVTVLMAETPSNTARKAAVPFMHPTAPGFYPAEFTSWASALCSLLLAVPHLTAPSAVVIWSNRSWSHWDLTGEHIFDMREISFLSNLDSKPSGQSPDFLVGLQLKDLSQFQSLCNRFVHDNVQKNIRSMKQHNREGSSSETALIGIVVLPQDTANSQLHSVEPEL